MATAATVMMVCYALETRHSWFILAFAGACVVSSVYVFLAGTRPSEKGSPETSVS